MLQRAITERDHGRTIKVSWSCLRGEFEGKISIHNGYAYVCQNKMCGTRCPNRLGYLHSYIVCKLGTGKANQESALRTNSITSLHIIPDVKLKNKFLSDSFMEAVGKIDSPISKILLQENEKRKDKRSIRNITMRNNERVLSFLPKGKDPVIHTTGEGKKVWSRENRQQSKIGKLIRKVVNVKKNKINDKDIETFVNELIAVHSDGDFKVVHGEDIRKWYHGDKYMEDQATLSSSCMRDDNSQPYFDIYVNNPDKCSMLILVKESSLVGRALLWTTDCGTKIMDRIYGTDSTIPKFKVWAKDNGYLCKYKQSYNEKETWGEDGETEYFKITLDFDPYGEFPYIDTFSYVNDGYITNDQDRADLGVAENTNGTLENARRTCYGCGCLIDDEDELVDSDGDAWCSNCAVYGENEDVIPIHDAIYVEGWGYYRSGDSDIIVVNGDYYHIDEIIYCEYSDEPFHEHDTFYEIDGIIVHESNANECAEERGYVFDASVGDYVEAEEEMGMEEV